MSLESARQFKRDLKNNPELSQKVMNRSIEAIIEEAASKGYDFTIAELLKVSHEEAESTLNDDLAKITRENFPDNLERFLSLYEK